jgi:hypothetical protein
MTIREARIEFWGAKGVWPTEEQEATIRHPWEHVDAHMEE